MIEYELLALYFVAKQELCLEKKEVCLQQTGTVCCIPETYFSTINDDFSINYPNSFKNPTAVCKTKFCLLHSWNI